MAMWFKVKFCERYTSTRPWKRKYGKMIYKFFVVLKSCSDDFVFSGLKKWVEIGNSGIFRPEMLLPMGLPENVSVIAWGLSLER